MVLDFSLTYFSKISGVSLQFATVGKREENPVPSVAFQSLVAVMPHSLPVAEGLFQREGRTLCLSGPETLIEGVVFFRVNKTCDSRERTKE